MSSEKKSKNHYIYAHQVQCGIKIGYTSNYKRRLQQYQSSGETTNKLCTVEITDRKVDNTIISIMRDMLLNIPIPDQSSTEVYNITVDQTIKLLKYIECNSNVQESAIRLILKDKPLWETIKLTFDKFRQLYGSKYVQFAFQRPVDNNHVNNIATYIQNNIYKPIYHLQPITAVLNEHNKYEILDGNHRTHAILNLPDDEKLLTNTVEIYQSCIVLTEDEKIEMFRNINSCKPIAEIYISDSYCIELYYFLIEKIKEDYGKNCVVEEEPNGKLHEYITTYKLREFCSETNIKQLLQLKHIKGLDKKEIYEVLQSLNSDIGGLFQELIGEHIFFYDDEYDITEDAVEFYKMYNRLSSKFPINQFKQTVWTIRNNRNLHEKIMLKRRKNKLGRSGRSINVDPFVLGLIKNTTIYDCCVNMDEYVTYFDKQ